MISYDSSTAVTGDVDQYLRDRDCILEELRGQYERAQKIMQD